jgi:ammonia channel protein AmtB
MDALKQGADALFILLGAIMVLAMHAGFAFLELGTVRQKNQVNALVKILVDFSISTVVYFAVGYSVAYGTHFFVGADELAARVRHHLVAQRRGPWAQTRATEPQLFACQREAAQLANIQGRIATDGTVRHSLL